MPILAKNGRKFVYLEPNIVWKRLVPFFGVVSSQKNDDNKLFELLPFFCPFLAHFWPTCLKHRVGMASTMLLCCFEPEKMMTIHFFNYDNFWPVFQNERKIDTNYKKKMDEVVRGVRNFEFFILLKLKKYWQQIKIKYLLAYSSVHLLLFLAFYIRHIWEFISSPKGAHIGYHCFACLFNLKMAIRNFLKLFKKL